MPDIPTARYAVEMVERDPRTNEEISITVYQDSKTDRYFGVDSSYLIDESPHLVKTPFGHVVELLEEGEDED